MINLTAEFVECIKNKVPLTQRVHGNIHFLFEAFEANPDNPPGLVETCMEHITSESVGTTSTFDTVMMRLQGISNWEEIAPEQSQALKEVITLAAPFRDAKEGVTKRDRILLKELVDEYINSLENNVQKVLVWLTLTTGVKPMDLLRDERRLAGVREGVIEVGPKRNDRHSLPRTVRFNPSYINEVLDPEGEHIGLIADVFFTYTDAGIKSRDSIGSMLDGTAFNFYQLRASHCIHRRQAGDAWYEIANDLGVVNAANLKQNVLKYAAANGIQLD